MDSLALSNLTAQICSVLSRIEAVRHQGEDPSMAQSVLRSLRLTLACVFQGCFNNPRDPGAFASGFSCIKIPGCEPTLRQGDRSLLTNGRYIAQVFSDAGAELFDYQVILMDPELSADVIDEAHARLVFEESLIRQDMEILRQARREAAVAMDAPASQTDGDSTSEAA